MSEIRLLGYLDCAHLRMDSYYYYQAKVSLSGSLIRRLRLTSSQSRICLFAQKLRICSTEYCPLSALVHRMHGDRPRNASHRDLTMDGATRSKNDVASQDKLPLLDDVMQLARLGEIEPMQKLFEQGKVGADFRDEENISPLHVSCIATPMSLAKLRGSGQPSTITMPCAGFSSTEVRTSTSRAAKP